MPSDHWATVEVLGQDGRYVSILRESDTGQRSCATWDVVENRPISLADYDAKHEAARLKRAARELAKHPLPGLFNADAFRVHGGHVVFCAFDAAGARHELEVP